MKQTLDEAEETGWLYDIADAARVGGPEIAAPNAPRVVLDAFTAEPAPTVVVVERMAPQPPPLRRKRRKIGAAFALDNGHDARLCDSHDRVSRDRR